MAADNKPCIDSMPPSRRRFLKSATNALSGLLALGAGVPLAGYLLTPVLRSNGKSEWNPVGQVDEFADGQVTRHRYSTVLQQGWYKTSSQRVVYVKRQGDQFTVFSAVCTHLGCGVRWEQSQSRFLCPCHNGVFDAEGKVVSGPPPRPLTRLEAKVEDGEVLVKEV
ncbi:MAG TPA: Rieske (2Fe-2S) protein [Armatimonadota bacterium]|jgi:Rieske Fe-S protein